MPGRSITRLSNQTTSIHRQHYGECKTCRTVILALSRAEGASNLRAMFGGHLCAAERFTTGEART
jgi:hypothetical protein